MDVKKLLTGIVALTIAVGCAVAQAADFCRRGMNRPDMTFCVHGNTAAGYDASGRLVVYGVRRGSVMRNYDASGRRIGHTVYNSSNASWRLYNTRGRYLAAGGR
jgi:YD repeat-containing protein